MHLFRVTAWVRISGWHQRGNMEYDWGEKFWIKDKNYPGSCNIKQSGVMVTPRAEYWFMANNPRPKHFKSVSGKIPVRGISRVSTTHISFCFSLDTKTFSLCRDYCTTVTSWTPKRAELVLSISSPARHSLRNSNFFYHGYELNA